MAAYTYNTIYTPIKKIKLFKLNQKEYQKLPKTKTWVGKQPTELNKIQTKKETCRSYDHIAFRVFWLMQQKR